MKTRTSLEIFLTLAGTLNLYARLLTVIVRNAEKKYRDTSCMTRSTIVIDKGLPRLLLVTLASDFALL